MANTFYTNVFRTQENVNKDNMNYTVIDKDQKLSAYFPMPSPNSPNGILPGVICSGIGTINNQFGFNNISNQFNLTAGVIRFPDAISNNAPYNVSNQTASISQFLALDIPTPQPALPTPLVPNTYYLVATLQVTGSGSAYQYTNNSPNLPTPPYTIIATSAFTPITSLTQVALCLITIVGTNVRISTDINCAINYGTIQYSTQQVFFQQGTLTGVSGSPYGDTLSDNSGSPKLYFTPTEQGNLISLYNGNNWVTQSFTELSLSVGTLIDLPNAIGSLTAIDSIATGANPDYMAISPNLANQTNNVYVTNRIDDNNASISVYTIGSNGILSILETDSTENQPSGIIVSPDGLNVYVASNERRLIRQFNRDSNGRLTSPGTVSIPDASQPYGITISPSGNYVYCLTNGNIIYQFSRSSGGGLRSIGFVTTGNGPLEIKISPNGSYAYVTCYSENNIYQYSIGSNGVLLALGTPTVVTGAQANGISISPTGSHLYVDCAGSNKVYQYSIGSGGGLTPLTPATIDTGSNPQAIIISPDGLSGYVTNSSDSNLSVYSRDLNTGVLTALPPTVATQTSPGRLVISTDSVGLYVYVANTGSSKVSEYSRSTTPPPPPPTETNYDIYVGYDTLNVLTLAKDRFSDNTSNNRTQQNSRWVNANGITTPTGTTIPSNQGLLVGSITVTNDSSTLSGKVQSWYGNRSIWNLYNQVSKVLQAYTNTTNPPSSTTWLVQGNGVAGQDITYFIVDKLYKQQSIRFNYNATVQFNGTNTDNCSMGIANNVTGTIVPLSSADLSGLSGSSASKPTGNINFSYNLVVVNLGFQFIQKVTRKYIPTTTTSTYYSPKELQGLTADFWG